jgi:hypothetical protein
MSDRGGYLVGAARSGEINEATGLGNPDKTGHPQKGEDGNGADCRSHIIQSLLFTYDVTGDLVRRRSTAVG